MEKHDSLDANKIINTGHSESRDSFGEVRAVNIRCISETGWFDNTILANDVAAAGGVRTSQYNIAYTNDNLGGYAALVEVEALDGEKTLYLLDSGWSTDWMDHAFAKAGVDRLLADQKIRTMVISHDHNDHFFGIESTLRHSRDLKLYFPSTAMPQSVALLDGADFSGTPGCPKNKFPHTGERIITEPDTLYTLQDGVALAFFDMPITLGVRGENVMYIKVQDKGYVIITGCGHPGILNIINYARTRLKDGEHLYGCYGGLHIDPFEQWGPGTDDILAGISRCGMKKIACNHCTGRLWAQKAIEAGLPIVKGSDAFLSYKRVATQAGDGSSNLYAGNGDMVSF